MKYLFFLVLFQFIVLIELVHQNSQLRIKLRNLQEEIDKAPPLVSFKKISKATNQILLGRALACSLEDLNK